MYAYCCYNVDDLLLNIHIDINIIGLHLSGLGLNQVAKNVQDVRAQSIVLICPSKFMTSNIQDLSAYQFVSAMRLLMPSHFLDRAFMFPSYFANLDANPQNI